MLPRTKCYQFKKDMRFAEEVEVKQFGHMSRTYNTIILTSEAREMTEAHASYTQNKTWRFRFVVNTNDTLRAHGKPM